MSTDFPSPEGADPVAQAAAEWVLRHDRGLAAVEQDEFSQWLAADPHHSSAWAEHRWGWEEFDRLAGLQTSMHAVSDPNLLVSQRRVAPHARMAVALAAVVVVAVGALLYFRPVLTEAPPEPTPVSSLALIEQRELPDGSVAVLNRGAIVTEHYSVGTRRVRLERGEAHFKVAKDSARPFLVEIGGVTVRAVGTAFNVRLDPASVEVLVTEGKVDVQHRNPASSRWPRHPLLRKWRSCRQRKSRPGWLGNRAYWTSPTRHCRRSWPSSTGATRCACPCAILRYEGCGSVQPSAPTMSRALSAC
jgi:transmembrane sensor